MRLHLKIIILAFATLILPSCGVGNFFANIIEMNANEPIQREKERQQEQDEASTKPVNDRVSVRPTSEDPDNPSVVEVDREFQYYLEEDCDGTVERVKRTVEEPRKKLRLIPRSKKKGPIKDSDIYNATTDDWRECRYNTCYKNDFDIHTSRWGSQAMHVEKNGINVIEYRLRYKDGFEEEGVRYIYIDYSEKTRPDEIETCICSTGCP